MKIRGLLLKDWYQLWSKAKVLMIMIVVYMGIGVVSPTLGSVALLLCAMLPYNSIAYDEKAKWDRYALSMPVSKKELILSKYLLGFIALGIGFVIRSLLHLIPVGAPADWSGLVLSTAGALIYLAIQLPLLFWFGTENGRLWSILLSALFAFGLVFVGGLFEETDILAGTATLVWVPWAALLLAAVLQGLSYLISVKVYRLH